MKLEECTKEELIFIIKRMSYFDDFHLNSALNDLEYKRVQRKLEEAERQASISEKYRFRYLEIAKKYAGKNMKIYDVPIEDLNEMDECLKLAQIADKKHDKLMKEVDAYRG